MSDVEATTAAHSARAQCADEECEFASVATSAPDDAQVRSAAEEHTRRTGHRVLYSVLDRTIFTPAPIARGTGRVGRED